MKLAALSLFTIACFTAALHAEEPEADQQQRDLEQISKAMGHLIGKNLQSMGLTLDINALAQGMKESCEDGKDALLSEEECLQALSFLQEETLEREAEKNLQEAISFLESNALQEGVVVLEEGRLQYRKIKEGSGNAVELYNSPILRYKGRYLNDTAFGDSGGEELISLDEAIAGLSKGIAGMKEGEVRTLYIHPDLAYGKRDLAAPNALLVFEVEVVKADASLEAQEASQAEDVYLDEAALQ